MNAGIFPTLKNPLGRCGGGVGGTGNRRVAVAWMMVRYVPVRITDEN